jgi:hypothetical protein
MRFVGIWRWRRSCDGALPRDPTRQPGAAPLGNLRRAKAGIDEITRAEQEANYREA